MKLNRPFLNRHFRTGAAALWLLIGIVVVAVVGAGFASYLRRESNSDRISKKQLFTVKESSFDLVIPASGEIEALNSIEIRNQLESRAIIKWIIAEGSRVKKGDRLITFASDTIEDRIQQAEIDNTSAVNALTAAQNARAIQISENASSTDKARVKVEISSLELDRWLKGESVSRLTELNLAVEKADRNLKRFARELAESEGLEKRGFISWSELEEDRIQLLEGQAALKNANLALKTFKDYTLPKETKQRQSDLEEAIAEKGRTEERNKNQLEQKESDLEAKQSLLERRQSILDALKTQLAACEVIAPADGLVVYGTSVGNGHRWSPEEPFQIGQESYPNQLLIILPDTSRLVASVKVHESQFNQIKPDMPAKIRVDALKGVVLDGKVENVGVMAEQSFGSQVREYKVRIIIDSENKWSLKPSMRCNADLHLGRVTDSVAVPIEAVHVQKGKYFVWMTKGDKYIRQPVTIGRASEVMIEITQGLTSGSVILLRDPEPGERA